MLREPDALLPLLLCGERGGGHTAAAGAATGACTGQADSVATCWTSCWRRVSVADNAWALVVTQLGVSVSPMETESFHRDSRSNNLSLCSARASTTEWA